MHNISSSLQNHLEQPVTTLATCWNLTRADKHTLGFTDHDQDLVFQETTYQARSGLSASAIRTRDDLAINHLNINGMLEHDVITEADILAGLYDHAQLEVFMVNYMDLSQGPLQLQKGWIGEVTLQENHWFADIHGLTEPLSQTIGSLYSPACRATFGDHQCKISMQDWTVTGTVDSVIDQQRFSDPNRTESNGWFDYGNITWNSGLNQGLDMEVKQFHQQIITLTLPLPYPIQTNDQYQLTVGCDKQFTSCIHKFDNAMRFRGEPHLLGVDR